VRKSITCLSRKPGVIAVLCGAAASLFVLISLMFLQHSWRAVLVVTLCTFVAALYAYFLWGEICAIRDTNDRYKWSSFCYLKYTARLERLSRNRFERA
jgi:hypothetical protein